MKIIRFQQDHFKYPKYIGAFLGAVLSIALFPFLPGLSLLIGLSAIYLAFSINGLEIDVQQGKYRHYHAVLGTKIGKWMPLTPYTAIIILYRKGRKQMISPSLAFSHGFQDKKYDVFLTNPAHRKRLFLKTFDDKNSAREFAHEMEKSTHRPVEVYNPQISQATRNRINQRRNRRR